MQPVEYSLKLLFYCEDINFGYFYLPNCKSLACLINKVVQNY